MKRFVTVLALTCALATAVFGGEIPSVPAPPPLGPSAVEGDMGAGGFAETITGEVVLAIFGIFAR